MIKAGYRLLTKAISRLVGTPPYIILFLSDTCWMNCRHCWFNDSWKRTHLGAPRLDLDELRRVAKSIKRIAFLSLTGGEAFSRSDVVEITAMFARQTKLSRYNIPTSGFCPDLIVRKTEEMLVASRDIPLRVDVSLDGTKEVHERVRRTQGCFENAIETVRGLNSLRRRYRYLDVGVITTISAHNQHQVGEIAEIVWRANPGGEWMINVVRGVPRDPSSLEVAPASYWKAHRLIQQRIEAGTQFGHRGHFSASWLSAKNATRRKIIHRTLQGACRGGGCAAGSLGGVIYCDGTVSPCELLDFDLGNVRDFDFDLRALWNSKRADQVRDWIQDTGCHCTQECFLSVSILIQPRYWPHLLWERLRLMNGIRRRPRNRGWDPTAPCGGAADSMEGPPP